MTGRRLAIVLIVSLALNLFLAGALGVFLYRQAIKAPPVTPTLVSAVDGMTPEHQAAFHAMLRAEGLKLRSQIHDAKLSRRQAASLFVQPDLDQAAVISALAHARSQEEQARAELEEKVVTFAAPLSVKERQSLAIILKRGVKTNRRTLGGDAGPTKVGKRNAPD
jgi:uncharacterized membrane protein